MFFTEMCPSGGTKYVSFEIIRPEFFDVNQDVIIMRKFPESQMMKCNPGVPNGIVCFCLGNVALANFSQV